MDKPLESLKTLGFKKPLITPGVSLFIPIFAAPNLCSQILLAL